MLKFGAFAFLVWALILAGLYWAFHESPKPAPKSQTNSLIGRRESDLHFGKVISIDKYVVDGKDVVCKEYKRAKGVCYTDHIVVFVR